MFERPRDTNDRNDIQFKVSHGNNKKQPAGIHKRFVSILIVS